MLRLITTLLLAATCLLHTEGFLIVSTETVVTCGDPNNVHHLRCDSGVISVVSALYGRDDSTTCPTGQVSNTACSQEGTLKALQDRCDGKKVCEVKIESIEDPDPCPGTNKYLETTHNCLPAFHSLVCEDREATLWCELAENMIIYNANYGRTDLTTCSIDRKFRHLNNDNCVSPGATRKVTDRCKDKSICYVPATNEVFGDPCRGIVKYLEIDYTCQKTTVQCENGYLGLSCFGDEVISIYSSFYGRLDKSTCAYDISEENLRDSNCSTETPILFTMCDGKPTCDIEVKSSVFGDPCPGTHKYMEVVYGCVYKP